MRVALLGHNAATHFIAQQLVKNPDVEVVHYGANENTEEAQYRGVNIDRADKRSFILEELKQPFDLIFPVTFLYQHWAELQAALRGKAALFPSAELAMYEWSKVKAKPLFKQLGIPTPLHVVYDQPVLFENFMNLKRPFVLKFDQDWRMGKQTIIVTDENVNEVFAELLENGTKRHHPSFPPFHDQKFIVEDYLPGYEYTFQVLCNGRNFSYLGAARDYKRRFEGDVGFNTSSMGSYAPAMKVDGMVADYASRILNHFADNGTPYVGILNLGILVHDKVPYLLEINTRVGCPEFQSSASLILNDLADTLYNAVHNKSFVIAFSNEAAVSARVVSKNYGVKPDKRPNPAVPPFITESLDGVDGRGYAVYTTVDKTVEAAANKLHNFLSTQDWGDYTYRTDIGILP